MHSVLLIEDDVRLAELTIEYLQSNEFVVNWIKRGDQAIDALSQIEPDMVILDLMLPGVDGMTLCREIRKRSEVPILVMTARGDSVNEVFSLEQGADDFVNKPVHPRVLLARVRAVLRRRTDNNPIEADEIRFGSLRISKLNRTVEWKGTVISLNSSEYKMLLMLAEAAGQVLSRNEIQLFMRGIEFDGFDRSIDNKISRLRRHFDDLDGNKIKTVWGEGYLFSPHAWD